MKSLGLFHNILATVLKFRISPSTIPIHMDSFRNESFIHKQMHLFLFAFQKLNPIPNRSGHVIYNERADSALTW